MSEDSQEDLTAKREAAISRLERARERGDTKAVRAALDQIYQATHELMRTGG